MDQLSIFRRIDFIDGEVLTGHELWVQRVLFLFCMFSVLFTLGSSLVAYFRPSIDKLAVFFVLYETNVKSVFQNQTADSHTTIRMAANHMLRPVSECPSVVLFLAPEGVLSDALRLAQAVGRAVRGALSGAAVAEDECVEFTLFGGDYAAIEDYWPFYEHLSRALIDYQVVIVYQLQRVHPQVTSVLNHIADDTYSPHRQAILLLVLEMDTRFSRRRTTPQHIIPLADSVLQELWEPSIDSETIEELKRRLTGRSVLVEKEQSQPEKAQPRKTDTRDRQTLGPPWLRLRAQPRR